MADIVSRYRLFKPYNQFDDTAVCKSCNDDSLSKKFYPKSSSIGGRKISPQSYSKLSPIEITNERKISC